MRRFFRWAPFFCVTVGSLCSQTTDSATSTPVFKTKVPVVIEDVVVVDRNGKPIQGLQKEDFQVFEAGKPQTILSFEEHKDVPDQGTMPPLPPDSYTNYPSKKTADSLDVLLLDSLNTPVSDQSKVRLAMTDFLKSIPAGSHIAIFSLSSGLHIVQGFTSDASVLLTALNKNPQARPQPSPFLGLRPTSNLDTEINEQLTTTAAGMPAGTVASADKLQQFQEQTQNSQDLFRTALTLQALQQLANFLTGIPGRKNVIWFSDSFPLSIIPGRGVQNYESDLSAQQELRKTVNMLAAAQVAIYPLAPQGLDQKFNSSESRVKSVSKNSWRTVEEQQISEVTSPVWDNADKLQQEPDKHARQNAHLATMGEIATETGGEAFYNTNGFKDVLGRVVSDGAHYYAISYSPIDRREDGHYRPIQVKLSKGDYTLAYRHGYFAEKAGQKTKNTVQPPTRDPLAPLMIDGIPDATQIVYKIHLSELPPPVATSKAENGSDKSKLKAGLTRYSINFAVLLQDLSFTITAEGRHETKLAIALVAYNPDGTSGNSLMKSANISLTPQLYSSFEKIGVQLHEEIEVPKSDRYLRTGICDLATGKTGTLEVQLKQPASP